MKRIITIFLTAALVFSLAACGSEAGEPETSPSQTPEITAPPTQKPAETTDKPEETQEPEQTDAPEQTDTPAPEVTNDPAAPETPAESTGLENSLSLLNTVWGNYLEEEKFPAAGGDYNTMNMEGPGAFDISGTETLDSVLGLPEAGAALIDDAASLMHMMNANTFTCGTFHASSPDNVTAICDSLYENIMARQWMCGFPDKLVITTIGNYIISVFGKNEIVDTFQTKLTSIYGSAQVVYDEAIA